MNCQRCNRISIPSHWKFLEGGKIKKICSLCAKELLHNKKYKPNEKNLTIQRKEDVV